jgi:hypothetical protein
MDESGNVLGIATLIAREGQNLGFAIAVEEVERALTPSRAESAAPPQEPPSYVDSGLEPSVPSASPNIERWPDGRILIHPEHSVRTCVIKVKSGDTLILRSGPGSRFEPVREIPRDGTGLIAFDRDRVWDGDTWWYPVEWQGLRGYVGRSFLGATN